MAIPKFNFDPPNGWADTSVFPTFEANEEQVRADMQRLHDQTRDYLNNRILPEVDAEIEAAKEYVDEAIEGIITGTLPDGSVTEQKLMLNSGTNGNVIVKDSAAAGGFKWSDEVVKKTSIGAANGVAPLDASGFLPADNMNTAAIQTLGFAQIASGSYVGTGVASPSEPCRLYFPFKPKLLFLSSRRNNGSAAPIYESTYGPYALLDIDAFNNSSAFFYVRSVRDGTAAQCLGSYYDPENEFYWYSNNRDAYWQMNQLDMKYFWVAIG